MQKTFKKIVIIGATSSIAEHCARLWLEDKPPKEMILVARNLKKTKQLEKDLKIRAPHTAFKSLDIDFSDAKAIQSLADTLNNNNPVELVLIAQGALSEQTACQEDLTLCEDTLCINGLSAVLFAEAFAKHMEQANTGAIAIIGSVAGDRGRKSNYIYGAAKGLVARYVEGLQHRFAKTPVSIILVKPGPTDTPMTAHLKAEGQALTPVSQVARCITQGIDKKQRVIYAPVKWRFIMAVIRHIPHFIFKKMDI